MDENNRWKMSELSEEQEQAQEVVAWYVPQMTARESVGYYVQPEPLPEKARPAEMKKKKSRKGLRVFLITLGVLAIVVTLGIWQPWKKEKLTMPDTSDDGTASSIINIFGGTKTTIPRFHGDAQVHLRVEDTAQELLTPQEIYERVNPATVLIMAQVGDKAMLGTGIIMTSDGYIITNAHVISGGEYCLVKLWNGAVLEAELVGYDTQEDLAVLHAVDVEGLPTATFADSRSCAVGDTVYAIGNPLGMELCGTMTNGIISGISRSVTIDGEQLTMLQTTAPLNNGNSGGPLINDRGQVIGINTMKMSFPITEERAGVEGQGFAIPVTDASPVINTLIAEGKFEGMPSLGIMVQTVDVTDGSTAVLVRSVEEGRAGDKAGVQPYDVILAVDGKDIFTVDELLDIRAEKHIGDTVVLTIYRDGETFDVTATMMTDRY